MFFVLVSVVADFVVLFWGRQTRGEERAGGGGEDENKWEGEK